MAKIIGRENEIEVLNEALHSSKAELIAIYGRRRIGKTYLIRNYYEDRLAFELTGLSDGAQKDQLVLFSKALQQATRSPLQLTPPEDWVAAFTALEQMLGRLDKKKKWVVFFDEFP